MPCDTARSHRWRAGRRPPRRSRWPAQCVPSSIAHHRSIPASIDEVYAGDANGAGEDNRNVGRMAVLLAGLPTTIPAATVNRLCGSGIEAIFGASRTVAVGDADITLACGVESMTRAPWVLLKPSKGYPTRTSSCGTRHSAGG